MLSEVVRGELELKTRTSSNLDETRNQNPVFHVPHTRSRAHFEVPDSALPPTSNMQTTNSNLVFKTDAQIVADSNSDRKREAAKLVGQPIQLSGKIINFAIVGQDAFVAESGWLARRVSLEVGSTTSLYDHIARYR